jgi:AAA ATPase domain
VGPRSPEIFINRQAEIARLQVAIGKRESLLILGPAGIGKTALVLRVLRELPPDWWPSFLYISHADGLHGLLRRAVHKLFETKDPSLRAQLRAEGVRAGTFKNWMDAQSSSRLKGSLYRAAESKRYFIFLDHLPVCSEAVAKVVEELVRMRNTPVCLLAREITRHDSGRLAKVYWSEQQRLTLAPLSRKASRKLMDICTEHYGLTKMDLGDFTPEILRLSAGVPGAVVKMCELASRPRDQAGAKIKSKLVHIDYLMRGERANAICRDGSGSSEPFHSG